MDTMNRIFIDRLEYSMKKAGMKPVDVCRSTGISPSLMSQYRSGACMPKQDNIFRLAVALNISPSWLIGMDLLENHAELLESVQEKYDRLSPDRKKAALEYLDFLLQQEDNH